MVIRLHTQCTAASSYSDVQMPILLQAIDHVALSGLAMMHSHPELQNQLDLPSHLAHLPISTTANSHHSMFSCSAAATSTSPLGFESSTAAPFSSICPATSAEALADSSSKPVSSNSHPTVACIFSSVKNRASPRIMFQFSVTSPSHPIHQDSLLF